MRIDRIAHFWAGAAICATAAHFMLWVSAFWFAVGIGVAKEVIWDWWLGKGDPDRGDAMATAYGALAAAGLFVAIAKVIIWWHQ